MSYKGICAYTSCRVCFSFGSSLSVCQRRRRLVLLSYAAPGLAVSLDAVDHCEQRLQGQEVGGVQLPRHWERVLPPQKENTFT